MNMYELMAGAIIGRYLSSTSTCSQLNRCRDGVKLRVSSFLRANIIGYYWEKKREEKLHYARYRLFVLQDSTSACRIVNAKGEGQARKWRRERAQMMYRRGTTIIPLLPSLGKAIGFFRTQVFKYSPRVKSQKQRINIQTSFKPQKISLSRFLSFSFDNNVFLPLLFTFNVSRKKDSSLSQLR